MLEQSWKINFFGLEIKIKIKENIKKKKIDDLAAVGNFFFVKNK